MLQTFASFRVPAGVRAALMVTGLLSGATVPAAAAGSAPIFVYFQVGRDEEPAENLRVEQFAAQMDALAYDHVNVLPLSTIMAAFDGGTPLPDRTVGLTFDDAYLSVADNALPVLKKAGFKATIFVTPKLVDRGGDYMSWGALRQAMRDGFDIGAKIDLDDIDDDSSVRTLAAVNESLTRLRDELGVAPTLFAYADGIATPPLREIVRSRGFKAAFALQSGPASALSDRFRLPRFPMTEAFGTLERFRIAANSLPLDVQDVLPKEQTVQSPNPPQIGFTIVDGVGFDPQRIACFIEDQGKAPLEVLGTRVEVRPVNPFEPDGETRMNCTAPGIGGDAGRWHWLGFDFYVPPDN